MTVAVRTDDTRGVHYSAFPILNTTQMMMGITSIPRMRHTHYWSVTEIVIPIQYRYTPNPASRLSLTLPAGSS